jgi:hypothetical protein
MTRFLQYTLVETRYTIFFALGTTRGEYSLISNVTYETTTRAVAQMYHEIKHLVSCTRCRS